MITLSELSGKTKAQLFREMHARDLLDLTVDAYFKYLKLRTEKACDEYNWWVDVYNFKRGKHILKTIAYHPIKVGRVERFYGERILF